MSLTTHTEARSRNVPAPEPVYLLSTNGRLHVADDFADLCAVALDATGANDVVSCFRVTAAGKLLASEDITADVAARKWDERRYGPMARDDEWEDIPSIIKAHYPEELDAWVPARRRA